MRGEFLLCLFVLACLTERGARSRHVETCHADDNDPYFYTSIKTPYSYVYNETARRVHLPGCKPLQIWSLIRHGTRYPNLLTILRMSGLTHLRDLVLENHEIHDRGHLCDKDLQGLRNWNPEPAVDEKNEKRLSAQGETDLSSLGKRLRVKFPELFDVNAPADYKFRSTDTQRTIASMKFFIKGAFGDSFAANQEVVPVANDTLLKIYETCEPWLRGNKSPKVNKEIYAFINGPEVARVVAGVSRRLGFTTNLSKEDVFLLYDACCFRKAWHLNETSAWCAAFTDDEMRVIEYEEDLYHYYHVGHGRRINSKLGCQPLHDMFKRFTRLERTRRVNDEPRGVFYFTHSEMIMLFFTATGIGKDAVPITASNFRRMEHRNWRTSLLVPFATNVVAVFYSCDSVDSPFKVALYLAEKPLTLESCENGVCDWARLKRKLGNVATKCSPRFCRGERL